LCPASETVIFPFSLSLSCTISNEDDKSILRSGLASMVNYSYNLYSKSSFDNMTKTILMKSNIIVL
jgi:hypothetical protein